MWWKVRAIRVEIRDSAEQIFLETPVLISNSISGLWTARICADHFEDVLIVEPDGLGESTADESDDDYSSNTAQEPTRKRVLQYDSAHGEFPQFTQFTMTNSL